MASGVKPILSAKGGVDKQHEQVIHTDKRSFAICSKRVSVQQPTASCYPIIQPFSLGKQW